MWCVFHAFIWPSSWLKSPAMNLRPLLWVASLSVTRWIIGLLSGLQGLRCISIDYPSYSSHLKARCMYTAPFPLIIFPGMSHGTTWQVRKKAYAWLLATDGRHCFWIGSNVGAQLNLHVGLLRFTRGCYRLVSLMAPTVALDFGSWLGMLQLPNMRPIWGP